MSPSLPLTSMNNSNTWVSQRGPSPFYVDYGMPLDALHLLVLEVGASIGHRTAWLLDQFERTERTPTALTLVEQGGKFAVILQRLLQRYEAMDWASVVVGDPEQLAAEHQAWTLASATVTELSQTPFESGYDVIVIDGPSPVRAGLVATYLPLLNDNGVLFTVEPDMPTGDVAEDDVEGMAMVNGFNRWIELVGETQATHHVAFMPLFGDARRLASSCLSGEVNEPGHVEQTVAIVIVVSGLAFFGHSTVHQPTLDRVNGVCTV